MKRTAIYILIAVQMRSIKMNSSSNILGMQVKITIDRPLGSFHPDYPDLYYPINYGYVDGIIGGDGEEQDVYLLGIDFPVDTYTANIVAIVKRFDDIETKWVAAPDGMHFSKQEIYNLTHFQERFFQSEIYM